MALPQIDIPEPLSCHEGVRLNGESCYGDADEDKYGNRLKWVTAGALLKLMNHEAVRDDWQNRAVWAYLAHMPAHWPIVLYWH